MAQQPSVGQGLLIIEDSWSQSDTPHLLGFLWTSDQPDAETSIWQNTTLTRDKWGHTPLNIHPCNQTRYHNFSPRHRLVAMR